MEPTQKIIIGAAAAAVILTVIVNAIPAFSQRAGERKSLEAQRAAMGGPMRGGPMDGIPNLTDNQKKKIQALESEMPKPGDANAQAAMKARLDKLRAILTPQQLASMPQPPSGPPPGGPGMGGPSAPGAAGMRQGGTPR